MRAFVAEQYLPADGAAAAACGADAAGRAAEQLTREGTPVQFVRSIFVPADETCFHLYLAESIEAVHAAAGRAALRLDRVSEALSHPGPTRDREAV
jgi:hypothetical protein